MISWLRNLFRKPDASSAAGSSERRVGVHPGLRAPYGKNPGAAPTSNPYGATDVMYGSPSRSRDDPGFDAAGFALGYATGLPISPSHGTSAAAMVGAAMHSNAAPSYDPPSASSHDSGSSYDSGSSSSSSSDSGSSSGGSTE